LEAYEVIPIQQIRAGTLGKPQVDLVHEHGRPERRAGPAMAQMSTCQ
jgi:hypothetical protein